MRFIYIEQQGSTYGLDFGTEIPTANLGFVSGHYREQEEIA